MIKFSPLKLKQLRSRKKLSLRKFREELKRQRVNVSRQSLLNWEIGKTEPRASCVLAIAKYFGVAVESLFSNS